MDLYFKSFPLIVPLLPKLVNRFVCVSLYGWGAIATFFDPVRKVAGVARPGNHPENLLLRRK